MKVSAINWTSRFVVGLFVETKELFGCNGVHLLIKTWNSRENELTRKINL
jgi:hypothetical protein